MTSLNQEPDISVHKTNCHGDIFAVGKNGAPIGSSLLDETEDVVPASAVESGRVIPQLKQNFFHLESGRESFNQDGGSNRVVWYANVRLREEENVIPEASFEIVFHFGEVEIGTRTSLDKFLGIMIKVKREIENGAGNRSVVDGDARFIQVPASRSCYLVRWSRGLGTLAHTER